MGHIIDPRPQVEATLERLRAEHEPRIQEAEQAVSAAPDKEAKAAAKQVVKDRQREYRRVQRQAKAILRGPMAW